MGVIAKNGVFFGEVIREIRNERGYSIEELARQINWSPSTIQKAETNKIVPTKTLVYDIISFLDMDGWSYEDFFIDPSFNLHQLREVLCNELEKRNIDRAFYYIEHYRRLLNAGGHDSTDPPSPSLIRRMQFCRLAEMIALAEQNEGCFWRQSDWLSLIYLTIPDYRFEDMANHDPLTKTEKMILNGMALSYLQEKEYSMAERLLYSLLMDDHDKVFRGSFFNRQRAALCNNLILLRIAKNEWRECLPLLDLAFESCKTSGGSFGYLNIAKSAVKVNAHLYGEREALSLYHEVRSCFSLAMHFHDESEVEHSFEEFWNSPSEMYIL